jgi:hypothetical protein
VVVHLAGVNQNVVEGSPAALAKYRFVNVEGTVNLARLAAAKGVRRFVFMSSIKASGDWTTPGKPFTGLEKPAPENDYGQTKLAAEELLRSLPDGSTMEVVIIRSPLVYGPGIRGNFEALVRWCNAGCHCHSNRSGTIGRGSISTTLPILLSPRPQTHTRLAGGWSPPSGIVRRRRLIAAATESPARLLPFPPALLELAGHVAGKHELVSRLTRSLEVDISETGRHLGWEPLSRRARDYREHWAPAGLPRQAPPGMQ